MAKHQTRHTLHTVYIFVTYSTLYHVYLDRSVLKYDLTACSPSTSRLVVHVHVHSVITDSNSVNIRVDTRMSGIYNYIYTFILWCDAVRIPISMGCDWEVLI